MQLWMKREWEPQTDDEEELYEIADGQSAHPKAVVHMYRSMLRTMSRTISLGLQPQSWLYIAGFA